MKNVNVSLVMFDSQSWIVRLLLGPEYWWRIEYRTEEGDILGVQYKKTLL